MPIPETHCFNKVEDISTEIAEDFPYPCYLDVAVLEEEAYTRFLAIECNPRFNGASYPAAIAFKLDIEQWEARNYRTWHRSLAEIDLKGLEYDPEQGEWVIIVNWGPVLVGKLMVMLAGPPDVRQRLEVKLKHRLW